MMATLNQTHTHKPLSVVISKTGGVTIGSLLAEMMFATEHAVLQKGLVKPLEEPYISSRYISTLINGNQNTFQT
jgi:hypothetical protein